MSASAPFAVSVAVAVYNGEQYLSAQLESIAGQTRPPDELVITDNTSNDATPPIVAAFADKVLVAFLPSADALERTTQALKELLGSAVYRIAGPR
jgi:glycosyltransferase involved in cell wall biosynthesis